MHRRTLAPAGLTTGHRMPKPPLKEMPDTFPLDRAEVQRFVRWRSGLVE
jgi:hypothetical protein